ncbi:hypothetical protein BD626DRAFT_506564 [Schizophyllum amplum]|uniref:Uncharacterized protein n=1 Tax=Schizophyllum amplum TaxID=97359 RepID=A0A550C4U7_9AGAR|nr:hypothetical protein BD626DRAFT_506564 [Auriculariopsis ampla]
MDRASGLHLPPSLAPALPLLRSVPLSLARSLSPSLGSPLPGSVPLPTRRIPPLHTDAAAIYAMRECSRAATLASAPHALCARASCTPSAFQARAHAGCSQHAHPRAPEPLTAVHAFSALKCTPSSFPCGLSAAGRPLPPHVHAPPHRVPLLCRARPVTVLAPAAAL